MSLSKVRTELLTHYLFGILESLTSINNMAMPNEKEAILKEALDFLRQHPSLVSYTTEQTLLILLGDK